jgi:hypothetical protein
MAHANRDRNQSNDLWATFMEWAKANGVALRQDENWMPWWKRFLRDVVSGDRQQT